jgi:hypothetical protein
MDSSTVSGIAGALVAALLGAFGGNAILHGSSLGHLSGLAAVIGGIFGLPVGFVLGYQGSEFFWWLIFAPERMRERKMLSRQFGDYLGDERASSWKDLKAVLPIGEVVSGEVFHLGGGDVWVDLHCGFPASLMRFFLPIGTLGKFPELVVGQTLEARVINLIDARREIVLALPARQE